MKPDSRSHNPNHQYLRDLVLSLPDTRIEIARKLGIHERTLRLYMSGTRRIPYLVQFGLECLVLEP
jgi:hypothetical protein